MQLVFYGMVFTSLAALAWQVGRRVRLWKQGQPGGFETDWRVWLQRVTVYALAQKRVHRKSLGAALHVLLFSGFVVLTIGTTLLMIADWGPVNFHQGGYYLLYEVIMDVFGVALCLGCLLAMWRRGFRRPSALGHRFRDWLLLGLLLGLGVTGFFVEAFRLRYDEVPPQIAVWSVIGHLIDVTLLGNLSVDAARDWHLGLWWVHAIMVSALFVSIPVTRFLHVLTGPANIAMRPRQAVGALTPLSLEAVEESGRIGVSRVGEFTRQQLMSLDACMECGRCQDACPAHASGKPLSPKAVVVDLRAAMTRGEAGSLHEGVIASEALWACTMCQACVQECPVLIGHVDLISDLRRHLVGEGQIAGPPARAMNHVGRQFNPFGRPASERMDWAEGLNVPTVESNPDFEYLLWIGCAGAFDPRAQKATRALVQLLGQAGVSFAVMGKHERCTGDPARRLGDEFLFQEQAQQNIELLNARRVRKIVTSCPHCFNTFKNEYPQFGGRYELRHHSQLLAELIASGKLKRVGDVPGAVTLHDPCYLARVNGEVAATRDVLHGISGNGVREMGRSGKQTFCCGAGGGRMWFDEPPTQRVSRLRASEAMSTGARTLATACPFCLNMMTDGVAGVDGGETLEVMDLAELLLKQQTPTGASSSSSTG